MYSVLRSVGCVLAMTSLFSCAHLGGKKIFVEFGNAEGIKIGDKVYLAGIQVGSVTAGPVISGSHARVSVTIHRGQEDALHRGTVFLLQTDGTERGTSRLVAYTVAASSEPAGEGDIFSGASNRAELALLLGTEVAGRVWQELSK
jgi:hypothetical protein